jgi:hypothetical protein
VKKLELELKMAPVPLKCPVAECVYKTPASFPNYDTVYKDLDLDFHRMTCRSPSPYSSRLGLAMQAYPSQTDCQDPPLEKGPQTLTGYTS